ncbi:hypothetical protein THAOC_36562, partial [Thalassiosira oceanica]
MPSVLPDAPGPGPGRTLDEAVSEAVRRYYSDAVGGPTSDAAPAPAVIVIPPRPPPAPVRAAPGPVRLRIRLGAPEEEDGG